MKQRKRKSSLLKDSPSNTLPKVTTSLYIKELFERSDKAIEKLKKLFNNY